MKGRRKGKDPKTGKVTGEDLTKEKKGNLR